MLCTYSPCTRLFSFASPSISFYLFHVYTRNISFHSYVYECNTFAFTQHALPTNSLFCQKPSLSFSLPCVYKLDFSFNVALKSGEEHDIFQNMRQVGSKFRSSSACATHRGSRRYRDFLRVYANFSAESDCRRRRRSRLCVSIVLYDARSRDWIRVAFNVKRTCVSPRYI